MKPVLRMIAVVTVLGLLTTAWLQRCSGADPEVRDVRLTAPAGDGSPYVVEATLVNHGGPGEVKVTVRLEDRQRSAVYGEEMKIRIDDGETIEVAVEVHAPAGDYEARVTAEYPPQ